MRRTLSVLLLALAAGLPQPAGSAELQEAVPGSCVSQLKSQPGLGRGIPTGQTARSVEVRLCDGTTAVMATADGAIVLRTDRGASQVLETVTKLGSTSASRAEGKGAGESGGEVTCGKAMLRDARPSAGKSANFVYLAWPTQDYGHGILGDQTEASGFCVAGLQTGRAAKLRLEPGSVFEDLRVRLVDLTGDGQEEFVVIRSYLDRGAALAVYHLVDSRIEHLAETPAIGIPNRWLNPAGAADFDGDGRVEIAYVETPHIGGTLKVWELRDGALQQEQAVEGFSNHAIGSRELGLSAVLDWNADGVPDLALPDAGRRTLRVVSFAGGKVAELDRFTQDAEITTAILATDLDADGVPELLYGLADGRLLLARP